MLAHVLAQILAHQYLSPDDRLIGQLDSHRWWTVLAHPAALERHQRRLNKPLPRIAGEEWEIIDHPIMVVDNGQY